MSVLAIHPSGQIFATGHFDGSIAFWAVDDEDRPLVVRTIDHLDINHPEAEQLDKVLNDPKRPEPQVLENLRLEPIFKLAWSGFGSQTISDPYSSSTVLTIMGGSNPTYECGITSLRIPSFQLPNPSTPSRDRIHPEIRSAIVKSLSSPDKYLYSTLGPAKDFVLISKDSPHFGGVFDPISVIIVSESPTGRNSLAVKEFPPPAFGLSAPPATPNSPPTDKENSNSIENELTSTLASLKLSSDPKDLSSTLPSSLWSGANAICDGDIVRLEKGCYEFLSNSITESQVEAKVGRGGIAWVDYSDADQAADLLFTKHQDHRLLVTVHQDLTVHFQDLSPQLLIGSPASPLLTAFPNPIPHLTISLSEVLPEPCILTARNPVRLEDVEIQSAQLTSESSECVVVLRSGHVLVFGYDTQERAMSSLKAPQNEIVPLTHMPARASTFQPVLMVDNTWGSVTACEMSNIGMCQLSSLATTFLIDN